MTNIVPSYIQRIIGVTWKVGGVGLIETYRIGSVVADKSHKYMFVTASDIKRIKYH